MYPMKLTPVFKETIWGGNKIKEVYGKNTPCGKIGESWEASAIPGGVSTVANGECAGMGLDEITEKYPTEILGKIGGTEFPLCFKIIDAADYLSVQVHPDDDYARENHRSLGKTEMWYILDCEPGAELIFGFNRDLSREEFAKAVEEKKTDEILNRVKVKPGDFFYIKAGTVHAIGKGILLAEIQQSSDITYRVFDWNRVDKNGQGRQLHIQQALEVADYKAYSGNEKQPEITKNGETKVKIMAREKYFSSAEISLCGKYSDDTLGESFHLLFVAEGEASINGENAVKGDTWLVPAGVGGYSLEGNALVLKNYVEVK